MTVNPAAILDKNPIPKVEELWTKLSGGVHVMKLDLKDSYQQLVVDPSSRKYATVNIPKGLFQYTRLRFRVLLAPPIFQREMKNLL